MQKTFYWDFFGPDAAKTAEHFKRHLQQFLERNACAGSETGMSSAGAGHQAVSCRVAPEFEQALASALKPRRTE
jgi:uncharacterized protein